MCNFLYNSLPPKFISLNLLSVTRSDILFPLGHEPEGDKEGYEDADKLPIRKVGKPLCQKTGEKHGGIAIAKRADGNKNGHPQKKRVLPDVFLDAAVNIIAVNDQESGHDGKSNRSGMRAQIFTYQIHGCTLAAKTSSTMQKDGRAAPPVSKTKLQKGRVLLTSQPAPSIAGQ